jgi:alpha-glucosidase
MPNMKQQTAKQLWWQKGIIYEIYLRTFKYSNDDGVGDLKGIITKLDYLKWLEIDALWVILFNPSLMKDFGYEVSDY